MRVFRDWLEAAMERAATARGKERIRETILDYLLPDLGDILAKELERSLRGTEWERYYRPYMKRLARHVPEYVLGLKTPSEIAREEGYSLHSWYNTLWLVRKVWEVPSPWD